MIDVVVADGQPLFRDALARVVRQDAELRLVAEAPGGRAALAAIERHRPAVALLAWDLPELAGDGVLAGLERRGLTTRVVVLDGAPAAHAWSLLSAGAAGVLSRCATPDAVRAAVHRVVRGEIVLCAQAQAALAGEIRSRRPERPLLSPREQQVLELVGEGLSGPRMAERLQLGHETVRTHLKRLYDKLEARDRGQLVRQAMRRGLLD